jgi:hypothetical protein
MGSNANQHSCAAVGCPTLSRRGSFGLEIAISSILDHLPNASQGHCSSTLCS